MKITVIFIAALCIFSLPSAAADLVGCYSLAMTPWEPSMPLDEDEIFVTPPTSIALTLQDSDWAPQGKEVATALGAKPSIHRHAYWQIEGRDIVLTWTTGFSGLQMKLAQTQSGLIGQATTFWDFDRPSQSSKVVANKISCGQPSGSNSSFKPNPLRGSA